MLGVMNCLPPLFLTCLPTSFSCLPFPPPLFHLPPSLLLYSVFPLLSSPPRVRGVHFRSRCGITTSKVSSMTSGPSALDLWQQVSWPPFWPELSPTLLADTQLYGHHTGEWHSIGRRLGGGGEQESKRLNVGRGGQEKGRWEWER